MDRKIVSNQPSDLNHTAILHGMQTNSSDDSEPVWQTCTESFDIYFRALKAGRLRGMVILTGCRDADADKENAQLVKELLQRDIWIAVSDCATGSMEKDGLIGCDAIDFAGEGLAEFCDYLDVPPVVQIGAGADRKHIANLLKMLADQTGAEIANLPVAVIVPEHSSTSADLNLTDLADSYGTILTMNNDAIQTADSIDAQIRKVRRAIQWCDRYHCTIHS